MEAYGATGQNSMPGVHVSNWETEGVHITEVQIEDEEGAQLLGKPRGSYVTLECPGVRARRVEARTTVANLLGEELSRLLPTRTGDDPVLIIGLGNRMATPDALGPKAVDKTLVTRHLFRELPDRIDKRMSPVCAIAPGVLGVTGVETVELVRSLVAAVSPRAVIAVDSLAARAVSRVGNTVQLTNTGIQPGSGVGNHRRALSSETLGVPVLAIGVPMVIYAATIVRDAFELLSGEEETEGREQALDGLTDQLLKGSMGDMIVTPREVDELVDDAAAMVAGGINRALHPGLSDQEMQTMMQ